MCGFAGFLSFREGADAPLRSRWLAAMGDAIAHRGPDESREFDDGRLALSFRRLAILDVQGGSQPFVNEDGALRLAVNGEIYNHRDLRRELAKTHRFASQSDCESVLHAWEEWGEDSLTRVAGMFALALWDSRAGRLTLARDRLGIKPLYLCRLPDGLLFASELKALLAHPRCPREFNWAALAERSMDQDPRESYLQGVELLPAGHVLSVDTSGRVRERSWWSLEPHFGCAPFGDDRARYLDHFADLLQQVTLEHLQRDVSAALMLSGGLDSSLLATLVARHEPHFPCLTAVGRASLLGGDVESARALTESLRLPWLPVCFDHRRLGEALDFRLHDLEQSVWMMDSPRFELEWLLKSELHRVGRHNVPNLKVMLLGQGCDEFSGGYSQRLDAPYADWPQYLEQEVLANLRQERLRRLGAPAELRSLLKPDPDRGTQGPYHAMMRLLTRQLQHHNLWHEDRSSSWHSLEARVPFLDHRLVEFLASVPAELHGGLFWRKAIVRETFARFAPPGVAVDQVKIGFLDSADSVWLDWAMRGLLLRSFPEFDERYLRGGAGPLDAQALRSLHEQVQRGGQTLHTDCRQLADAMALQVFLARLAEPAPPTAEHAARCARVALPVAEPQSLASLKREWESNPYPSFDWMAQTVPRLRPGVRVLTPLRESQAPSELTMLAGGQVLGHLAFRDQSTWLHEFLRHIGTPAADSFTVQDWLDEFELGAGELQPMLDMLVMRGVLEPPAASHS